MTAKLLSFGLQGISGYLVEIEVSISWGLPALNIVGLPDSVVKESRERVKAAVKNSGYNWPAERITISLAPSAIRKEGSSFDLGIALSILYATGQITFPNPKDFLILGELSLDGTIKPIKGVLPIAMEINKYGYKNIVLPLENIKEASIISEINCFPVKTLREAVELLNNPQAKPFKTDINALFDRPTIYNIDFSEVKGQYLAKRAIEIAVAGGHNIAMIGPPGSGKTMLAKRIPTIMPELTLEESLELTKLYSLTNLLSENNPLMINRPFRSPHHTASNISLIGGGTTPTPGEISMAHNGVLFLDELPEFKRASIEALRQPLEEGKINICRIRKSLSFPASFLLVVAFNPCPCGFFGDAAKRCRCNTTKIENYIGKLSGPLLDRIDIHIEMPRVKYTELSDNKEAEASSEIKLRVKNARLVQKERFSKEEKIIYNARMDNRLTKKYCSLGKEAKELMSLALNELGLSVRAYDKILKISRTIADLEGIKDIQEKHISEAIQYRSLDRKFL
ncbi:MAG: YifB family Mg chelatase-like AAA ATPase [Candidatus Omnitrophota bacterium]